jgi:hypothetical protein
MDPAKATGRPWETARSSLSTSDALTSATPSLAATSAIEHAIELAQKDAREQREIACRKAASWCERWAQRFDDESFEEGLLSFERLADEDRQALREWRAELIENREAARRAAA